MNRLSTGEKIFQIFNYIFLTLLAICCLYPFLYTLTISLSTAAEAAKSGFHIYPKEISLEAYKVVLSNESLGIAYLNTIGRTVIGTVLALVVTTLYAYALSRRQMPCKKFFTMYLLFTMLFSGGTIPTYLIIKNLGLLDNRLVYILPSAISAYNVIIARSFFISIPESLHESALLDGASEFKIFSNIYIPLAKPVVMTLLLWIAVGHWNAWYDSMIYITDNSKIVVQLLLQRMVQQSQATVVNTGAEGTIGGSTVMPVTIRSATIMAAILPILAVYPFIQKYFMSGIMLGAVKG
ncbi:MAG: carbohydrate ABC transporter permease [Clostridia bacterium]|nr:carbohydrate ABC transporter permease [Clostridia bacterium]